MSENKPLLSPNAGAAGRATGSSVSINPAAASAGGGGVGSSGSGSAAASQTSTPFQYSADETGVLLRSSSLPWTLGIINTTAIIYFLFLFVLTDSSHAEVGRGVAFALAFIAYIALAMVAVVAFIVSPEDGLQQKSAPWIFVLGVVRATEYITRLVMGGDSTTLQSLQSLTGAWGFFFGLAVVNSVVREYLGYDQLASPLESESNPQAAVASAPVSIEIEQEQDTANTQSLRRGAASSRSRVISHSARDLHKKKIEARLLAADPFATVASQVQLPSFAGSYTADVALKSIFACCIVLTILVFLPADSPWVAMFVTLATCVTLGLGFVLVRMLIIEIQQASISAVDLLFGRNHTNGLVLMALIVGMLARMSVDALETISGVDLVHYLPTVNLEGFLGFAKETLTEIFPLLFHFVNIFSRKAGVQASVEFRLQVGFYLVVLFLRLVTIGYVVETLHGVPFGATFATSAGFVAALDCAILLLIIVSPIFSLFFPVFNFGGVRDAVHKLHVHRNMAYSAVFFGALHSIAHIAQWIATPDFAFGGYYVYSMTYPYLYTGILMLGGFIACVYSSRYLNHFSVHLVAASVAFIAFFVHGASAVLLPPTGDSLVFWVSLVAGLLVSLFFALYPTRRVAVDLRRSACGRTPQPDLTMRSAYLLLLVVDCPTNYLVTPGSYFVIYDQRDGRYPFLHGHPFPVFSSASPGKLAFLIQCRDTASTNSSFTKDLYKNVDQGLYKHIHIQGPFGGSATVSASFLEHLSVLPQRSDVYLCGLNSGFAPVFSLLEHLKTHWHLYRLRAIFCVFSISDDTVSRRVYEYVDELVTGWSARGLLLAIIDTKNDLVASVKALSEASGSLVDLSKESDGDKAVLHNLRQLFEKRNVGSAAASESEDAEVDPYELAKWVAVDPRAPRPVRSPTTDARKRKGKLPASSSDADADADADSELEDAGDYEKSGTDRDRDSSAANEGSSTSSPVTLNTIYACGVEPSPEDFPENWRVFVETTSPHPYSSSRAAVPVRVGQSPKDSPQHWQQESASGGLYQGGTS